MTTEKPRSRYAQEAHTEERIKKKKAASVERRPTRSMLKAYGSIFCPELLNCP